jgi:hypothetical protein
MVSSSERLIFLQPVEPSPIFHHYTNALKIQVPPQASLGEKMMDAFGRFDQNG